MTTSKQKWVMQLCHGYDMPFHDIARQYTRHLKALDYQVLTVFLTGDSDSGIAEFTGSDKVIFLENHSRELRGTKGEQVKQVRAIFNEYQPGFIIAQRYKAMYIASRMADTPIIGVCHAFGVFDRLSRRAFAWYNRRRLTLLGVSNAVRDDVRKALPFFPKERVRTQYNHIDVKELQARQVSREKAREHLNLPRQGYIFGNVGRLHPDKDQASLVRAFARVATRLPDASLVIIGKGKLEQELKALASYEGVQEQVKFLGVIPNAPDYFKAFDSFVLTSDHEPFGMVLLEAMAAGIPVAATDCGGAAEIIKDNKFPLGDVEKISKTMASLYKQRERNYQEEIYQFSSVATVKDLEVTIKPCV